VSRSHAEQLLLEDDGTSEENVLPDAVSKTKTTATTTGKAKLKKVVKRRRNSLHQVTATMAARAAEAKQRIEALKNESALKEQQLNQRSSSMASASKAASEPSAFFPHPPQQGLFLTTVVVMQVVTSAALAAGMEQPGSKLQASLEQP